MKKKFLVVAGALIASHSFAQSIQETFKYWADDTLAANDARLLEQPKRAFTAEEALNGTMHWVNPYKQTLVPNAEGFDMSKIGKTPANGIHPRIFTSPDEFAAIKSRLETTTMGKRFMQLANDALDKLHKGDGKLGQYYQLLKTRELVAGQDSLPAKELGNLLAVQGLLAQLNSDKALLTETGTIAARYLKALCLHIDAEPVNPVHAMEVKEALYTNGEIAKLFDFTAAGMSAADKQWFIKFYTKATYGHYGLGMEMPPHWRRWNHIAMSIACPLSILAVENEKGWDKRIFERGKDVVSDYLTYSYTPEGMSSEGIVYTFNAFPNDLLAMAAIARRDKTYNTFTNPHFRAIPDWLIYTLAPNAKALWHSHGDTGSTADIPWLMMMIMKYFFPTDAKIDYLYANSLFKDIKQVPDVSAFVFCMDPDKTAAQYNNIPPVQMPLTYFVPTRGSLVARNKWGKDGLMFQFDGRQDMMYQSHDHADRGNFWLAANGRVWVMDGWRSTESKYHSVITIDGRGQGYFATPAAWKNYFDKPEATFGTVDYKYCFDWSWLKSPVADNMVGKQMPPQWAEGVYKNTADKLKRYYPNEVPQRDPLRKVADYYNGNMETNPLMWGEDTWPMRLKNYPVEYAFRTAGLVKGKHDYVLIVDDIKKDNQEHLYEWAMPMQLDVELVSIKQLVDVKQQTGALTLGFNALSDQRTQGEYDIVLGDKRMKRNMEEVDNTVGGVYNVGRFAPQKGDPQLLVRVLESTEAAIPNQEPNPRLEAFENLKTEDMHQFYLRSMDIAKRLVVPSRSTSPNFKVLLFPYLHGEELPKTLWDATRTHLTVTWKDQKDEYTFTKQADGHTVSQLVRDGKVIF
ncbi:hypothetical protein [Parasediminibacterium sp. JCM 36343]|uniref:hypothetical protein n=1 Tax=Parasediminibacterium sp. JCM 36343 TaxID=3374279 RepID=UPI00397C0209